MRAIAIDFETANNERSSPCALGLAWIEGESVTRRAYFLIRPREMRFESRNTRIHGVGPEDVVNSPEFPDIISDLIADFTKLPIVAHNAAFDIDVLCKTLSIYKMPIPKFSGLCTLSLSRQVWPGCKSYELSKIAQRIGFKFGHHHAGEDAYACAHVALAAKKLVGATSIQDLLSIFPSSGLSASVDFRARDQKVDPGHQFGNLPNFIALERNPT